MSFDTRSSCERLSSYALGALSPDERAAFEAHVAACDHCWAELEKLQPVVSRLAHWPTDDMKPPKSLRERLRRRIASGVGHDIVIPASKRAVPAWQRVAPGISCKLLSTDALRNRVSMLVRLDPGGEYPPHTHAGIEELHLLDGELWIDDRKLHPGDYNRAEPGTSDQRVWSETGCTCVLITSPGDLLR